MQSASLPSSCWQPVWYYRADQWNISAALSWTSRPGHPAKSPIDNFFWLNILCAFYCKLLLRPLRHNQHGMVDGALRRNERLLWFSFCCCTFVLLTQDPLTCVFHKNILKFLNYFCIQIIYLQTNSHSSKKDIYYCTLYKRAFHVVYSTSFRKF